MHPAISVIFFSTLTGLGYGVVVLLALGFPGSTSLAGKWGWGIAFLLISAGLLCSTLHLRNPGRARYALSQWRTSWLSREGVLAFATFVPLVLAGGAAILLDQDWFVLRWLAGLLALATVYSTSMIYRQLKAVHAWATWLTTAVYLCFALAGGAVSALALGQMFNNVMLFHWQIAMSIVVLTWGLKGYWFTRMAKAEPSSPETATGLGELGDVKLLERPHATENYLNREMGFKLARKHSGILRRLAILLNVGLPLFGFVVAQQLAGMTAGWFLIGGVAAFWLGSVVERWLFFAEAKHAVNNYY